MLAISEGVTGVGMILGPVFGSAFFILGGYDLPFYAFTLFNFVCLIVCYKYIVNIKSNSSPPQEPPENELLASSRELKGFFVLNSSEISEDGFMNDAQQPSPPPP